MSGWDVLTGAVRHAIINSSNLVLLLSDCLVLVALYYAPNTRCAIAPHSFLAVFCFPTVVNLVFSPADSQRGSCLRHG